MGLFDFVKDAGEKLFGGGGDSPAVAQRDLDQVLADKETGRALTKLVQDSGLATGDVHVKFRDGRATVEGTANSQADRERIVLVLGNTKGVAQVEDQIHVEAPAAKKEPEAVMYTVQSGDSLSKIAKAHYGNASKYMAIFEANKPMLKDPNKIYPGQVLRIPPLEG